MRQQPLALLGLALFGPLLTAAVPHDTTRYPDGAGTPSAGSTHPSLRPWRRLSDAIIRKIWGIPETQTSLAGYGPRRSNTVPGSNALARHGQDVVLRFQMRTAQEAQALAEAVHVLFLDVWEFNDDWADVRIAKDVIPSLLGLLPPSLRKSHQPLMQDVDLAQAILDSYPASTGTQSYSDHYLPVIQPASRGRRDHPFFQDYQPLSVINPWMNLMGSMFTTHVRRITIGHSYEGREIPALRIGVHPTNNDQPTPVRKTVLITAGSHAREWISTSTVNYLAWSLIKGYGRDQEVTRLLESFDFVLVPTLNPDGYEYTWSTDRLWRKNRQPTSLRFCHGIDLDRAYSYMWDGNTTRTNPCSESFGGDAPFDGVEAVALSSWARNQTTYNNVEFIAFFDLHSYSEQILYPYSFSCNEAPPALEDLEELALGLAKAIRTSAKGHAYKVTSACEGSVALTSSSPDSQQQKSTSQPESRSQTTNPSKTILPFLSPPGGSALDFFHHDLHVKYAFQIKLRDTGSYGFLLPKEDIVPTGEEMFDALVYFGRFVLGEVGILKGDKGGEIYGEESNGARQAEGDDLMDDVDASEDDSDDETMEL